MKSTPDKGSFLSSNKYFYVKKDEDTLLEYSLLQTPCGDKKESGLSGEICSGIKAEVIKSEVAGGNDVKKEIIDRKEDALICGNSIDNVDSGGKLIKNEVLDLKSVYSSSSSCDCGMGNASWDSQLISCNKTDDVTKGSETENSSGEKWEPELELEPYFSDSDYSRISSNLKNEKRNRKYKCSRCSRVMKDEASFQKHLKTPHSTHKLKCRPYPRYGRFECPYCDYVDIWGNKNRHLQTHLLNREEHKQFSCDVCDYKTREKSSLKKHMVTHSTARPFQCEYCDYTAKRKSHLTSHIKLRHSRK